MLKPACTSLGLCLLASLSVRAQRPARPAAAPAGGAGWDVQTSRSEMTDQPEITAILLPLNRAPRQQLPALAIRCIEGELAIVVYTEGPLEGEDEATPIRMRWGTEPPEAAESWSRSTNYTAAFAPSPEIFILELLNFPDLKIEYRPEGEPPRVASFNARGLARHMPKLRSACPSLKDAEGTPGPVSPARASSDSPAVSQYLEAMHLDLVGLVLAEEKVYADDARYTRSMPAIDAKLAVMGLSRSPGVTLIIEDVKGRTYRVRATHRSAPGWTCSIYMGRAQPYRPNQQPGEWQCWKQ